VLLASRVDEYPENGSTGANDQRGRRAMKKDFGDRGIGSWLARRDALSGDRVAICYQNKQVTYSQLERSTNQLASAFLTELHLRRGDRVAMLLLNSLQFVETLFAAAKLGAIAVPINYRLSPEEVNYILMDSGADVLVVHQQFAQVAKAALEGTLVRHVLLVDGPAGGEEGFGRGAYAYQDLLEKGSPEPLEMDVDPRDVHGIMYTSGTTGKPKGAMLTHQNAIANARNALLMGRGLKETDVTVTVAPMFHIGGLGVTCLPFIYVGARDVILPAFDPADTLATMARERATVQFLVPAMWAALMQVPDFKSYDLSSLELALSGGAPCPLTVIEFFRDQGVPFQEGFGMTETAPSVAVLDSDHVVEKAGSIGRPLFHVSARIVDDLDREVPTGEVGELVLQGENIFDGYWMLPKATAEAFKNGWFHTGDLGKMDNEGFITLVDRKKDMIITGGENVYPIEVEQVIYRHAAVLEAAVFGVPDARWGEEVVAAVALKPGASLDPEELISFCREKIAHFKCPRRIVIVDQLPRNATGKVLKTQLRQAYGGSSSAVSR
jgi:acyl-CoA synthetase (AMP-forming)/AMP-acid ligase II